MHILWILCAAAWMVIALKWRANARAWKKIAEEATDKLKERK